MIVKVFLLGRPGSGKTTSFHHIEMLLRNQKWHTIRFREYTILHEMFQNKADTRFHSSAYGGFEIVDFSVFFDSAKWIEQQIETYIPTESRPTFIFIELARDDYSQALKSFSSDFLKDAYFLFLDADIDTCIERIHTRVANRTSDGHFISEGILKSYYCKDNRSYMISSFKTDYNIRKAVEVIDNFGSIAELTKRLNIIVSRILAKETHNSIDIPDNALDSQGDREGWPLHLADLIEVASHDI